MNKKFKEVKAAIVVLALQSMYRPLAEETRNEMHALYRANMNGFDGEEKRHLQIEGASIASDYERVVVGDYGAYVEITPEQMTAILNVPDNQKWRLDQEYVKRKNLSLKYQWYVYGDVKVYKQIAGVSYADYKPGMYYISVLDFDELS